MPGDCPDRYETATASGDDIVICDLEAALPPEHEATARANDVADWLGRMGAACVRLRALDIPFFDANCAALAKLPGLRGIPIPNAAGPERLAALGAAIGFSVRIAALIGSALGIHRAYEIAAIAGVVRLAFDSIDFALDTGATEDDLSLLYARAGLVSANAHKARRLGFSGRFCVHPHHVRAVNEAFAPTDDEVPWARTVTAAARERGASRNDTRMIDKPVADRACQILKQAKPPAASMSHEGRTP